MWYVDVFVATVYTKNFFLLFPIRGRNQKIKNGEENIEENVKPAVQKDAPVKKKIRVFVFCVCNYGSLCLCMREFEEEGQNIALFLLALIFCVCEAEKYMSEGF